jgi:pimeloyl-ACP methyl ester carboxylesterase
MYSVDDRGRGVPIVFAHGVLMDKRIFQAQVEHLQTGYRCVSFDFRGQGASEVTPEGYGIDDLTLDTAELIERLGASPCHFVGHSMGSFVGIRLAARRPDLIRSLFLIAPSAQSQPMLDRLKFRGLQMVARRFGVGRLSPRLMKVMFGRTFLADPSRTADRELWLDRIASINVEGAMRSVDGVLTREGVEGELARISTPTLVVMGEEDVAAPRSHAELVAGRIAGARLLLIASAGHLAPVESRDEVTSLIEGFISAVDRADVPGSM